MCSAIKKTVVPVLVIIICCQAVSVVQAGAPDVEMLVDQQYFPRVKQLIDSAGVSVQMIMFQASYYPNHKDSPSNLLIRALTAAVSRGVRVEVVLDVRPGTEPETTRNRDTARMLHKAGVDVAIDPDEVTTHAKVLIIDGRIIVLGSTNWTYSALVKNHEASAVIRSVPQAVIMQHYFEKLKKTSKKVENF